MPALNQTRFKRFAASDTACLQPTRIIQSATFRLAALFALLFLTLTGALIGTVLWIVAGTQESSLVRANDEDIGTVMNGFRDEGLDEALEVVRQRLGTPNGERLAEPKFYMLIEDGQGRRLAGNLPAMPTRLGALELPLPAAAASGNASGRAGSLSAMKIVGRGVEIRPGYYLFVGRDTEAVTATRTRILYAFTWVALGATVIAVLAGLFLGARFMQRVDAIASTCRSIMAGRVDDRIPLRGSGDEWDRLAAVLNEMLDRNSMLLSNLRQVSSDVAHDLRTPLTRLRNRLEEAHGKSTSVGDYSVAVSGAIDDTDKILSMFAALLRISQVEAGTRAGSFAVLSLSALCEKVCQLFTPVAEDYQHTLTAKSEPDVAIMGDAELLMQMFTNVIENAIRHTPPHTHIVLELVAAEQHVSVAISDNGPGVPHEESAKILRRFYRTSTSRATPGNGLGLALVAAIAQLHHAQLTVSANSPGLRVAVRFARYVEARQP